MEDTHGGQKGFMAYYAGAVLILIIMEDTHGAYTGYLDENGKPGLNPYYNGRYSWSFRCLGSIWRKRVLILIIMEDTHGVGNTVILEHGMCLS